MTIMSINFNNKLFYNLILHSCIVILFFLLSFVINKIPEGTFVAGGDFYQLININDNLNRYLFTWFNQLGQGQYNPLIVTFPFYAFQSILFKIGFSYTNIANAIMFLFFIGSFYSFFFAIRKIDENIPNNIRLFSSAIYAINVFTFTIFTYSWWITHHFVIYIFIPLLIASFEKIITSFSRKDIVYFIILFTISTMGFNNIAYFAALLFLQVLLLIAFFATKRIPLTLKTTKRILFIFILQLFLSIYFILPFFTSQFEYVSKISGGNVLGDYVNWLSYTSNNAYSIFSFTMVEGNYPLINLYSDSNILLAISLGYIILLFILILNQKDRQDNNWLHYLIFFIPYLFLLMRLTPPFDRINTFIYTLPGFNLFRSPEKLFVFYPFFYLVLLSLLLYCSKFSQRLINIALIMILIIPIPFYIGGIPAYLSHGNQAGYKYTIQIPSEYYGIKEIINDDHRQLSIISLPYSVVNSINWVNYPKWHFVGYDVLHLLFEKFYISANSYDHSALEQILSFKEYNEANEVNKDVFLELIQKFSGQYILSHKDISYYWQENSNIVYNTIEELETDNTIKKLDDNEYFELYELDEKYLVPLIFSDNNDVYFQKINPTKYRINISNITKNTNLVFHQSYNSQWKLFLISNPSDSWCKPSEYYENTKTTECEYTEKIFELSDLAYILNKPIFKDMHLVVNEYANGWTIDPEYIKVNYPQEFYNENQNGGLEIEMVLYFKPQSYFYVGLIISGLVFIGCVGYLLRDFQK